MERPVSETDPRDMKADSPPEMANIATIIIGRNEGERLSRCLASIPTRRLAVYVDSGSTDDSLACANAAGFETIALPPEGGFTAARARNAGIRYWRERDPEIAFFQMLDGDCEIRVGWLAAAVAALQADPGLCAVFGRRRERFADTTVYNRLCDIEWTIPPGPATAFGGDVLLRCSALASIGGYCETMIAGEDPDLSICLRKAGWRIACIDADMTWHDAAITRFGQWWRRTARAGHAFAELAARHPEREAEPYRASCRRILIWGGLLPATMIAALLVALVTDSAAALALFLAASLAVPAQIGRLTVREARHRPWREALALATFLTIGKYAEFKGMVRYGWNRLRGHASVLIEYKGSVP